MRFKSVVWTIFISVTFLHAQTDNEVINEFIERYIENTTDEVDIQQFASALIGYYDDPLDINNADASELFEVPFFSGFQALAIIEHRKKFGNFISLYELQVIPGFTTQEIQNILPFISIKSSTISIQDIGQIWREGTHQFMSLVETGRPKRKGYLINDTLSDLTKSHYTGSPIYNNLRYRFDYKKNISFGVNMEKDAHESFLGENNPMGYDYYSYYFSLRDVGNLKTLNLGDFQANFGQGLTLSTGLAFGKSSIITNAKRNFNGFKAYRSLRENAYLRGGAVAFELKKLELGVFASYKKVDGNAVLVSDSSGNDEVAFTTNIQEDGGLHRTLSELGDKDAISDFQTGIYAEYKLPFGRIGTINYLRNLGASLEPSERTYNKFNFRGDQYMKNGLYYDLVYRNMNVYGEVSRSSFNNSYAQVHGALLSLNSAMDISMVYRNYDKSFISLQSTGFGETSNTSNENGFYIGFESKLSRSFRLLGYYDLFGSKWLRSSADGPTTGKDLWAEIHYKPNKQFRAYYRFRTETKQANLGEETLSTLTYTNIQRHRVHMNFTVSKGIELRNRIETSIFTRDNVTSNGSMIYQDIIFKPFGKSLQLSGRAAYSVIENFNNRIYSFEQVPLYDYPLFTHSYSGMRFYILSRYKIRKGLDIWFRYALSQYDVPLDNLTNEIYTVGSGLEETIGNNRQIFTLQVRYQIK